MNIKTKSHKKTYLTIQKETNFNPLKYILTETSTNYIFILFRSSDKTLKILFAPKLNQKLIRDGYKVIGRKACGQRDYQLIKLTLKEFGYNLSPLKNKAYNYSNKLIKSLFYLGYTTSLSKTPTKKYYYKELH